MECSKGWLGKGTTFFSTNRTYTFDFIKLAPHKPEEPTLKDQLVSWVSQYSTDQIIMFVVIVISVLVLMSAIFAVLQCLMRVPQNKRDEKF